jgi:hypothetical protein
MSNTTKGLTYVIGIFLTLAMVASTVLPLLTSNVGHNAAPEAVEPTAIPEPTLPAPPDTAQINFDDVYLHPSGLFTVGVPTGWNPTLEDSSEGEVRVSLGNSDALSVIETRIITTEEEIADGSALSAYFSDSWLGSTWRDYQNWEETNRSVTEDGHVVIDFNLTRTRANYIARQEAWVQDGEIYSVRVVTAENAPEELKFVLDGVKSNVNRVEVYAESPFDWSGYFDNSDKHMIRYPDAWDVTDAADGLPATIAGDDTTLLVETVDVALDSEEAAIDWIEGWRSGVDALTVESIEVDGVAGYEVSYKLITLDGAPESGLAVLLNGSDNRLHVANGRISNVDVDLQTDESGEYPLGSILETFRLFPDLNVTSVVGQQFAPVSG